MDAMARPGLRLGFVILGGLAMGATAAPVGAWPLAWVGLVPLWVAISPPQQTSLSSTSRNRLRPALTAAGYGFVWGFLYGGITVHWLWFLHPLTWMGVPWLASLGVAAFCWGVVAVTGGLWFGAWAGLFSALGHWTLGPPPLASGVSFSGRAIAQRLLLGVGLWGGLDAVMQRGILYWPSLAFTQSPVNLAALHLSRLSGPTTLAVVIVAVNGLLAEAWRQRRGRRHVHPVNRPSALSLSRPGPRHLLTVALALVVAVHALGLLLLRLPNDGGLPLVVGIIQGNVPTQVKLYEAGIRRAVQGYTRGYLALVDQGADVVVLPEGAFPFRWTPEVGTSTGANPLGDAIRDRGVAALVGTFAVREGQLTQSLLAVEGDGDITGRYDKLKLVPLGEYIPFQNSLGRLIGRLSPVQSDMVPGEIDQTFRAEFGQAIVGICYESAFPDLFRLQAAAGGSIIITASNNDPYPTTMMAQHHAQDLMRAIETDRWAVRATNTGYSGIIDSHGRTRWRSDANIYNIKLATVEQRFTQTPYVRWGDWLTPLLLGLNGVWLAVGWRRRAWLSKKK